MKLSELLELHSAIELVRNYNNDLINSYRDNWGQVEKNKTQLVTNLSNELSKLTTLDNNVISEIKNILLNKDNIK